MLFNNYLFHVQIMLSITIYSRAILCKNLEKTLMRAGIHYTNLHIYRDIERNMIN